MFIIAQLLNLIHAIVDFTSVFLNGTKPEPPHIKAPYLTNSYITFKVHGNIYGLKKTERTWNQLIPKWFHQYDLQQPTLDDYLYFFLEKLFFVLHVDEWSSKSFKQIYSTT